MGGGGAVFSTPNNISARNVCVIFPFEPDPRAFIERTRSHFKNVTISLYTANAEAARRAGDLGLKKICFRRLGDLHFFAPRELRGDCFDAVVLACEARLNSHQAKYLLMFLVQVLLWRGTEKFLCTSDGIGSAGNFWRYSLKSLRAVWKPVLTASLMQNFLYAALYPWAVFIGLSRGRSRADAAAMTRHLLKMLAAPYSYLMLYENPTPNYRIAMTTLAVLSDFARGPARAAARTRKSALIVRLDHMGDLIHSTGVLSALKCDPDPWHVTMVVGPWGEDILRGDDRVDALLVYHTEEVPLKRSSLSPSSAPRLRREVRRKLRERTYDLIIDPISGIDQTRLAYQARAPRRISTHSNRWFAHGHSTVVRFRSGVSESERLFQLMGETETRLDYMESSLRLPEEIRLRAMDVLDEMGLAERRFLVLGIRAEWPGRMWPFDRFVEIARRAKKQYSLVPIAFFYRAAESDSDYFMNTAFTNLGGRIVSGCSTQLVCALIEKAAAFVGNDSGLMHVAATLDIPTVGIFGPGDIDRWGPRQKRARAVSLYFPCSPCNQSCCMNPLCMTEIDVKTVWNALEDSINDFDEEKHRAAIKSGLTSH